MQTRIIVTAELERDGRTARIVVAGEVDLAAGGVLEAAAGRLHPSHDHVVIDLRAVTFVDIAGFDNLLRLHDQLRSTGCEAEFETTGMAALALGVLEQARLPLQPLSSGA